MVSGPQSRDQRARDRTAPGGDPRRDARHGPVGGALDLGFAGSDHRADLRRLLDVIGYRIFNSMMEENRTVTRLEIPIIALKVWTRGEVAWFAMELDYIRYIGTDPERRQMVLPLRETGVLERRHGEWVLTAWHESFRAEAAPLALSVPVPCASGQQTGPAGPAVRMPDLSGEWEVQEEDKSYKAALDRHGNGLYSWQSGRIVTTVIAGQKWQGTWQQSGNDREGGFELVLSEDGSQARGVWWYTRVGEKSDIPPRQWGGSYVWKRTSTGPTLGNAR